MTMVPNPGNAGFFGGYSPGPRTGLPTSPDDRFAPSGFAPRATKAMFLGLLAIFPLSILAGVPAIFYGAHGLREIAASEGAFKGRTRAWTGIALGCVSIVVFAVVIWRNNN